MSVLTLSETVIAVTMVKDTGSTAGRMQFRCQQRATGEAAVAKRHRSPFLRGGAARKWARSPCLPSRLKISTGRSPAAPNQWGTCVSNSATSVRPFRIPVYHRTRQTKPAARQPAHQYECVMDRITVNPRQMGGCRGGLVQRRRCRPLGVAHERGTCDFVGSVGQEVVAEGS